MAIEYEVKLLGVDVDKIRNMLSENGAVKGKSLNFRRVIFDTTPIDKNAWVRLRTDGDFTSLTYKRTVSRAIDGTEEIEVSVDSFDHTRELLEKSGLSSRNYQENRRELFYWNDCEISIDTWPMLEPYVEIESTNTESVESCVARFSGLYQETTTDSTDKLYDRIGVDLKGIAQLRFSD